MGDQAAGASWSSRLLDQKYPSKNSICDTLAYLFAWHYWNFKRMFLLEILRWHKNGTPLKNWKDKRKCNKQIAYPSLGWNTAIVE